jgi:hypothetical protein
MAVTKTLIRYKILDKCFRNLQNFYFETLLETVNEI